MGYGDDIMATAEAKSAVRDAPDHLVLFGDPNALIDANSGKLRAHYSPVFENNPNIARLDKPLDKVICICNYPGSRPYIDYQRSVVKAGEITKYVFNDDFRAEPGEVFFTDTELSDAIQRIDQVVPPDKPVFLVEPNGKTVVTSNKLWLPERWVALGKELSTVGNVLQLGPNGTPLIETSNQIETPSFRDALAILYALTMRMSRAVLIATDGGLHHAAAAIGLPAVVLWTGYTSPKHLGYDNHINIAPFDLDRPFGIRRPYAKCEKIARSITAKQVFDAAINGLG